MKYLYVYKRMVSEGIFSGIEIMEEPVLNTYRDVGGGHTSMRLVEPIARIPVEDLLVEQKQEEAKEEVSDIDKQIRELEDKRRELIEGLYE